MNILLFLVIGLTVGGASHALAGRVLVEGKEAGGWVGSLLVATTGAMLGGFAGRAFGLYADGNDQPASFILSLMASCCFVAAYQIATRHRLRSSSS
jgi:uncharacterized membrane protein YeaQ/YmgE (transglycosylase-associated protein family)